VDGAEHVPLALGSISILTIRIIVLNYQRFGTCDIPLFKNIITLSVCKFFNANF
jgi:hypothetical protein